MMMTKEINKTEVKSRMESQKFQPSLKPLSNAELVLRFGKLVQTERKITHLVLECIAEIDTRKLYLEKAYPSIYEYLTKEFGYSPSAALRRIESARLLREIPEISERIEKGSLNLSQLSKVQQAFRSLKKTPIASLANPTLDQAKLKPPQELTLLKQELLNKIENTTQNQTELILAKELDLPLIQEEKTRIHQNESVTLTLTFSKEEIALLEKVQDLVAHAVPEKKWAKLMIYLAHKEIKRRVGKITTQETKDLQTLDPKVVYENQKPLGANGISTQKERPQTENSIACTGKFTRNVQNVRKPLPLSLQKHIRKKYSCCQYRDPLTKKLCGAQRFLEIDHRQPVWAGGLNTSENLTLLCSQHNKYKYAKEANLHPLQRYLYKSLIQPKQSGTLPRHTLRR